jgi:H+/Cl- antiporter ClcA
MRLATLRLSAALVVLFLCGIGIRYFPNDNGWAVAAWLGFIFFGIPFLLLAIRDFVLAIVSRRSESFRAWLMIHICAVFAGLIGVLLAWGARASAHPKADLHQWLPLVLVGLVYAAPIFLALHSGSLGFIRLLIAPFRRGDGAERK